ncbi:MAG: mandelate racemase/muconate lactonizing enzyme family protein [Nitrospinota bacterium]
MVRIEEIETIHVALPTRRAHKWTGLTGTIGGYVLVRIVGDGGTVGWGEAPVIKDWGGDYGRYFGESPGTTMYVVGNYLAPAVTGVEAGNFAGLHTRMDGAIRGYPYAKAAVEMAAYDLAGRSLGVPVCSLLGGRVRDSIPVTHSIGFLPMDEAVAECVQVVQEGIRTIKIKVGVNPKRDIEIVRQVREAAGEHVDLCVDANQGYSNPGEAIQTLRAMEPYGLKYAEQPVEGMARMAEVARAIDTPVMADESAWNAHDVLEIVERRAADLISIYTTKPGGLYRAMEVAAVARSAGLPCNVNGSVETGVGNRANVHLAAAAPSVTLSCVVPISTPAEAQHGQLAGIYYIDDLILAPFEFSDGAIQVPQGPGMGTGVDEDKVARYRVDRRA